MNEQAFAPVVGFGFRYEIRDWITANRAQFDILEVTIDHYLVGGAVRRRAIEDLVDWIPLTAHGIGLSIGTGVIPDPAYLDDVARAIEKLKISSYSEHLAFTKTPGYDLANLLPLPRTVETAECIIENVRMVRERVPVRFLLENISYAIEYPDSDLEEVDFLNLICRETGAGILLDVENLFLNSRNLTYDPYEFIDALPAGAVQEIHTAGGDVSGDILIDTHDQPVPDQAMALLEYVLRRHSPDAIILERDGRLHESAELINDLNRIREAVANVTNFLQHDETHLASTSGRTPQIPNRPTGF